MGGKIDRASDAAARTCCGSYLKKIARRCQLGDATEHTYRGDLEALMRGLLPGVEVTNEPRSVTECGVPDYVLRRNKVPIGYIEAKDLKKSLDDKEHRGQLQRYVGSLDNLIFTNYLEFRFYRDGGTKPVDAISIAELRAGQIEPLQDNFAKFAVLIRSFGAYQGQTITAATDLAARMADKARLLANIIEKALASKDEIAETRTLESQMQAFKKFLIADITVKKFADVYAQTIAYGMFAARMHDPEPANFSRHKAAQLIPRSNPFLGKFFGYIAAYELDQRIRWLVDDLAHIFRATNMEGIMKDFGRATQRTDPFIHFYETFLGKYDKKERKSRGVYYTPEPVVHFIVRAVDEILKKEFHLSDGLAATEKTTVPADGAPREMHKVQILDPAAGTGTFLAETVKRIYEKFAGQKGAWPDYVKRDLIPRLNGFEVLMAPYAMAHIKLEMILRDTGCELGAERLRIFLTNSLEEHHPDTGTLFASWLSDESKEANEIKRDVPVMVVLGNPPYAVSSSNAGEWIQNLIESYKQDLKEKKLNLDDDYIKFIRYGEYLIDKTGEGVLAYISNNSFIEGITHRQMRRHLLETFDKIYILDLHGNSERKEVTPDGFPDKNVFDIKQGVAINIFIKSGKKKKDALGEVFHSDLFGVRESKYEFLWNHKLSEVNFQKLKVPPPGFFFVPKDFSAQAEYEKGFGMKELFPVFNSGVKTDRDSLFISRDKFVLSKNIMELLSGRMNDDFALKYRVEDSSSYKLTKVIQGKKYNSDHIACITYRPFDSQWIYYDKEIISRPAYNAMRHILAGDNSGLVTVRQVAENIFNHILVVKNIVDLRITTSNKGTGYFFPLYLYPDERQARLDGETARKPNLNTGIVKAIAGKLGLHFTPEKTDGRNAFAPVDLLDYIYAILHSPAYRKKFREFLRIDFPRIPFPRDKKQFRALAKLGAELRALHLMESEKLDRLLTAYPQTGDNTVAAVKFDAGKVWINKNQYFAKVPKAAWEFCIGGYQPAQKWLKDRKDSPLSWDDIQHYQKIIVALAETAKAMKKIDDLW